MLSPNQAFILFTKQSFSTDRQVFNPNFVPSADLFALVAFNMTLSALPDSTGTDPAPFFLKLSDLDFYYSTQPYVSSLITMKFYNKL